MSLQQKAIRDAVVGCLEAALPADTHIFRSIRRELGEGELPAVCIYSVSNRPEDDIQDQRFAHHRIYTLRVEVRAIGRPEEDITEGLCDQIRAAVLTDPTLGALCHQIGWADQLWDGEEQEQPLAGTALDFQLHYLHEVSE
jgi:hypothetical protein